MAKTESDARWISGQAMPGFVTVGDPRLRAGGRPVTEHGEAIPILDRMTELLRDLGGAGLAAPQIGVPLSLAVVEVHKTTLFPDRPESPLIRLANPVVTPLTPELEDDWEGCFSVPGLMGLVPRHCHISVGYRDLSAGEDVEAEFTGYVARVIQHEVDHLEGRLFLDRMRSMDSLTTVDNYREYHHGGVR